jgi:hypothetical protein
MLQHPTVCLHRKVGSIKTPEQQNENETILTYNLNDRFGPIYMDEMIETLQY